MSKYVTPDNNITSDLGVEMLDVDIEQTNRQCSRVMFPRLACKVNIYQDRIIFSRDGREFGFYANPQSGKALQKLLLMMDGNRSIAELQQICAPNNPEIINTIVRDLEEQGLLDDVVPLKGKSGTDALGEIEKLTRELLDQSIAENLTTTKIQINILYGFAIEHYHLFSRRDYFQSPVLGFQASTKVRQLLNEFYSQAYGEDGLLMEALNGIGITSEDIIETMPLPETMAMCNGFAFWANYDPLFFLSNLGFLADNIFKNFELYLAALHRLELNPDFIEPIEKLVKTKLKNKHNISHPIFEEIPYIDRETKQRFRQQTYLFLEIYNNFYTAIVSHYSSCPDVLRRVSVI